MSRPPRPFAAGAARRLVVMALAGWLVAGGCTSEHATEGAGAEVYQRDHVAWSAEASWQVQERLRIGSLDGSGADVLGEVGALALGPGGGMYVYDRMAHEVRKFSANGMHEWTLGGPGPGPGEFQDVASMAVATDGKLWTVDPGNRRYTILVDGQLDRTIPREQGGTGGLPVRFSSQGMLLDSAPRPGAETPSYRIFEMDDRGVVTREYILPATRIPLPTLGMGVMVSVPHAPRFLRALDPRGAVWHATTDVYRIARLELGGDTTVVTVGETRPSPLTPDEQSTVSEALRTARERFSVDIDDGMVPTTIGPLRWMVADDRGHLWVCATGRDPCDRLDVIDEAGIRLGMVTLPTAVNDTPLPVIRDGYFLAAIVGPSGEPQVLLANLRRPGEP